MSHELAHHRWSLDQSALGAEMSEYINQFLAFKADALSDGQSSSAHSAYYRTILDSAGPEFLEEVFADDFGALIAMRAALTLGIRPWQASLGVVLAFKYLRLFRHLEILSHRLATLPKSEQVADLRSSLKSLQKDVWDADTGSIGRFQFREHFLRYRLSTDRKKLPDYAVANEQKIVTVVGEYDEKTELPSILGLIDRLSDVLTPNLLFEMESSVQAAGGGSHLVDQLTGWQA